MDLIKENKKKVAVFLFSALILGGVSYGIVQNQSDQTNDQVIQTTKPSKKSTENSILDRLKDNEDTSILDKVTGDKDKSDVILQASGADKTLLSSSSIADDLSNFDKQATKADKKQVVDEIIVPKSSPIVETMSNKPNLNKDTSNNDSSSNDKQDNKDQVIVMPEAPSKPTPIDPTPPTDPTPVDPTPEPSKPTDYSSLIILVNQAKAYSKENYVSSTYQALENEISFAERLISDKNATQDQVNVQDVRLQQAINNLVRRGDKSLLNEKLQAAAAIDRSIYTADTLAALDAAVTNANGILNDIDATQGLIDQNVSQLNQALEGLKKLDEPDLTLVFLNRLIQECEGINLAEYTPQSVSVFQPVLDQSRAFVAQSNITEESAKQQLETLENAKKQLTKKANTNALQQLINEVNGLNQSDYTSDSWSAVAAALLAAEQVLTDENAAQEEVNTARAALYDAKSNLVREEPIE